jgi:hypothetical protein
MGNISFKTFTLDRGDGVSALQDVRFGFVLMFKNNESGTVYAGVQEGKVRAVLIAVAFVPVEMTVQGA